MFNFAMRVYLLFNSQGALGFKCARKGTTVAAQAVGASLGEVS